MEMCSRKPILHLKIAKIKLYNEIPILKFILGFIIVFVLWNTPFVMQL